MSIKLDHQTDSIQSGTSILRNSDVGGFIVPNGNDNVDKPLASSNINGLIRYNTTTNLLEGVVGGTYVNLGVSSTGGTATTYVPTVGGTADAITLSPSPAITSYDSGAMFTFKATDINTGTVTINISGIGAVPLRKFGDDVDGIVELSPADIITNNVLTIVYIGTYFRVVESVGMGNTLTLIQTKANIDSPNFTGTPQISGDNIATITSPNFVGTPSIGGVYIATNTSAIYLAKSLEGTINGLELSTNGSTVDIGTGYASNSLATDPIIFTSPLTGCILQTSGSWTAGINANKLDTGTKANSTCYHVFITFNNSTYNYDAVFSLSATSPTMPTGYTKFRRIGSIFTDGSGNIRQFIQNGDEFTWQSPILDVNTTTLSTTGVLYTIPSIPTGVVTKGMFNMIYSTQTAEAPIYVSSPNVTDLAPSKTVAPLSTVVGGAIGAVLGQQIECFSNTSAQIRARSAAANTSLSLSTLGYYDRRGRK